MPSSALALTNSAKKRRSTGVMPPLAAKPKLTVIISEAENFAGRAADMFADGFDLLGPVKAWCFTAAEAPASVRKAWNATIADMGEADVMLLEESFLPLSLEGFSTDAPLASKAAYADLAQRALDATRFAGRFDQSWQQATRSRQIELLAGLIGRLQKA